MKRAPVRPQAEKQCRRYDENMAFLFVSDVNLRDITVLCANIFHLQWSRNFSEHLSHVLHACHDLFTKLYFVAFCCYRYTFSISAKCKIFLRYLKNVTGLPPADSDIQQPLFAWPQEDQFCKHLNRPPMLPFFWWRQSPLKHKFQKK